MGFYNKIQNASNQWNVGRSVKWDDCSWHNDTHDSIGYCIMSTEAIPKFLEYIEIYLPNSTTENICVVDEKRDTLICSKDIKKVIEFVHNYIIEIINKED